MSEVLERYLQMIHEEERGVIEAQKRLLMRLNKQELIVLAKHYKIADVHFYTEPGEWAHGGKEELAGEIAEKMT